MPSPNQITDLKIARGYGDAVIQPDLASDTPRGTENRFSVAERAMKFSVVSVERDQQQITIFSEESTRRRKPHNEGQKESERRNAIGARACDV